MSISEIMIRAIAYFFVPCISVLILFIHKRSMFTGGVQNLSVFLCTVYGLW